MDNAIAGTHGPPDRPAHARSLPVAFKRSVAPPAANVVDIRRFSTHDGDGIRTTIFLKGCSLACVWCQNPETIGPRRGPVFFRRRCIDCGVCVDLASSGEAYWVGTKKSSGKKGGQQGKDGRRVQVDVTVKDADWQVLVDACPTGAIAFNATRYTVDELVELVKRDKVFFGDNGGVTLSGGEPLLVGRFAEALLRALKAEDIDTAIETALNVRPENLERTLPHLDHIFADCKILDNDEHKRFIGEGNERVIRNLQTLLTGDRKTDVTIRTPLIPGVTATQQNITDIAQFLASIYPEVEYELLNFNPMAAAKYEVLPGREFVFDADHNPRMYTKDEMAEWKQLAEDQGLTNVLVD